MKLEDTVQLMLSEDYAERFKAEYYQLSIRLEKLHDYIWNKGRVSFDSKSKFATYIDQYQTMKKYLAILRTRANDEGIEL